MSRIFRDIFCSHFPWKLKDEDLRKISPKFRRIFRRSPRQISQELRSGKLRAQGNPSDLCNAIQPTSQADLQAECTTLRSARARRRQLLCCNYGIAGPKSICFPTWRTSAAFNLLGGSPKPIPKASFKAKNSK